MAVEQVNQDILKILGLEETDEIDMKSYKGFLREKLIEISMGKGNLSRDEELIIQSEFQRIKKEPDTVKVKKKKISAADIGITRPSSALINYKKVSALSKDVKQSSDKEGAEVADKSINSNLKTINETLDKILKSIVSQGQSDRKRREKDRVSGERKKSQERESALEKPLQVAKNLAKKIIAPFKGLLDSVFRFLQFTFLGWLIGKFDEIQKWTEQNKEKINVVKRFLKDWWPSLLFAAGLFLTPFGKFVRGTIKMIRAFIPRIIGLVKAHPILAGAVAAGVGAYVVEQQISSRREDAKKLDPNIVTPKETAETGKTPGSPQLYNEQMQRGGFGGLFAKGGRIPLFGFSRGANLGDYFSGYIDKDSGTSVTGFGQDTQAFPVEGGGTAVLKPGEVVMNTGAVNAIGANKLLGWNKQFGGPNANKPINFTYNGGGIVGMQGGGILGKFGKPKGLGFSGVRAGFTGMAQSGYEAIMGGAKFKNPNKPSLFGKGSRPVMGHGAYNAPTVKGASRYAKPGGGIIRSIVPRGAVGNPLVDIFEPQSKVRPSTFDKGKQLADKLIGGKYANSPLANKLRQQLMSGKAVDTMTKVSGLGRGAALTKVLGSFGRLANPIGLGMMGGEILSPLAIKLAEQRRKAQQERLYQLVPSGAGTMPSDGSIPTIQPLRRQSGGVVPRGTSQFGEVPLIRAAMNAGIKGSELAAFLSQMSHETGGFKWSRELGRGEGMGYSGGSKYHGRGYTQLTHDYNYRHYGKKLGVDLLKDPDILLKDPSLSAKVAIEYWKEKVRPNVKNWDDVFAHSAAINYPSATSPKQIRGYEDRVSKYNYYNKNLNEIISRSLETKPKSNIKPKPKSSSVLDSISGFFGNLFGGSAIASPMPKKKQGGGAARFMNAGRVSTTTGADVPGGMFGADTQYIPSLNLALQPGEDLYVVPKQAVPEMDSIVAKFDRSSNPAKNQSNLKPSGPRVSFINLPDKIISSSQKSGGGLTPGKPKLPEFDVIMDSPKRMEVAAALGISDLV